MTWLPEPQPPEALYTWIYRLIGKQREYIAGTAGRIRISDAGFVVDALNEYSLTIGEGK